jgi:hypothetical protein
MTVAEKNGQNQSKARVLTNISNFSSLDFPLKSNNGKYDTNSSMCLGSQPVPVVNRKATGGARTHDLSDENKSSQ